MQNNCMYLLRLCSSQEYEPRLLEHWLCTMQKHNTEMEITFLSINGKIHILTSHDLSQHLYGSRSTPIKSIELIGKFFAQQKKGPLLPIKRPGQFEDRVNKSRIYPSNTLTKQMAKVEGSFIRFTFSPIAEKKRRQVLKKAKKHHFQAERLFDQWESKGWFRTSIRRILGPAFRKAITSLSIRPKEVQEQTQSLHEREDPKTATLDKLARPLFKVKIEMSHPFRHFLSGFTLPYLGELRVIKNPTNLVLSAEELSSLASFPNPIETTSYLETESTAFLPLHKPNPLNISDKDRRRHLYILGKTGMGKSTCILHLLKENFAKKQTTVLIDPHGDLTKEALKIIPTELQKEIAFINPANKEIPLAINPVEKHPGISASLQASALIEMFEALARGSWGPRLEYILRNTLLLLILAPNTTLLDLPRILTNEKALNKILSQVKDLELLRFWKEEFLAQDKRTRQEHIAPILNKVGPLITSPLLRNIFGQPRSKFNFTHAFKEKQIVLISLSKGEIGQDACRMLGMIFISMIQASLLQRAALLETDRHTVFAYIDEFQNFSTPTLLSMLAESRKYGLALTIANQYLTQLAPEIQDAVLGNIGSLISFRLSHQDAEKIAPQFGLTEADLTNLAPFNLYAKLLSDAKPLPLFRWQTPLPPTPVQTNFEALSKAASSPFGRKRSFVEEKILSRYNAGN